MARSPIFYFGTVIFFIGLILFAAGVSEVIGGDYNIIMAVELISGFILMAIGFRASTRPPQSASS
jgi:hypothetical protein